MKYAGLMLGAMLLTGANDPPVERLVSGDALVPVTIDGHALRLRVEPNALVLPLLVPMRARELGLKGGGMFAFGVGYRVGGERLHGRTQSVKFGWDGGNAGMIARPRAVPHIGD